MIAHSVFGGICTVHWNMYGLAQLTPTRRAARMNLKKLELYGLSRSLPVPACCCRPLSPSSADTGENRNVHSQAACAHINDFAPGFLQAAYRRFRSWQVALVDSALGQPAFTCRGLFLVSTPHQKMDVNIDALVLLQLHLDFLYRQIF